MCGVPSRFPHSATESLVSYPLSALKVTRFPPDICSSNTSAASRSTVSLACDNSALTIRLWDSPPTDCRCSRAWPLCHAIARQQRIGISGRCMGLVASLLPVEIGLPGSPGGTLFSLWRGKRACRVGLGEVAYVRQATCCIAMVIAAPRSASRRPDAGIETDDRIDDRGSAHCPSVALCCTCPGEIRRLSVTLWQPPEMPASSFNVERFASEARPVAPTSWFNSACWIRANYRRYAGRLIGSECVRQSVGHHLRRR
jgi:hypothetical protein